MIFRSFLSSGDKLSSSTSTSSLSKYCMSSGFIVGRLPFGCRSTTCVLLSGVCIRNPTGVPASGVGVAVSLRAGVRIGTYPAGGCRTYSIDKRDNFVCLQCNLQVIYHVVTLLLWHMMLGAVQLMPVHTITDWLFTELHIHYEVKETVSYFTLSGKCLVVYCSCLLYTSPSPRDS